MDRYSNKLKNKPFADYNEFMQYMFDCVNTCIDSYLERMKAVFSTGQGQYKNVLYPDIEVASDVCRERIEKFVMGDSTVEANADTEEASTVSHKMVNMFKDNVLKNQ